jgi:hemolysin activation/secretion protein
LFGAEQITIGGYNSASAFRENVINGDNGYFLQNKITIDAKQIFTKLPKNNLELEVFHDYGAVFHNKPSQVKSGRISDVGLKINFIDQKFTTSLTSSWAIHQSNMLDYNRSENYNLYFNIGIFLF